MVMKRAILTMGLAALMMTVSAQVNTYIVKTRTAQQKAVAAQQAAVNEAASQTTDENAPTDFISQNFKFYSLCDWKEGMKFMVMPEKYDLIVRTFSDAATGKEVSSMSLRHKIMIYRGHTVSADGHSRVNFFCQDNNKMYYFEIPNGSFDDYCYGKLGVPTLAYLGDVDIAKEKLMGKKLYTKGTIYRVDTEYDGDGYREVKMPKDLEVTVTQVGVGSRSFPVKIIVEDENGNEFYQTFALSKTNSGMRDDEFIMDRHTFYASFELQDAIMSVNRDFTTYIGKIIHTAQSTKMLTKGDGKDRTVNVPKMTTFRVDQAQRRPGTPFVTLALTEMESRRPYYRDVLFTHPDDLAERDVKLEDYFGYIFGMGEGEARATSKESRAAIREGRVIRGMSKDEVQMAMGEPFNMVKDTKGRDQWMYARSNGVILDVWFDAKGKVTEVKARATKATKTRQVTPPGPSDGPQGGTWEQGTPLH